jgi:WD40 repeat protein
LEHEETGAAATDAVTTTSTPTTPRPVLGKVGNATRLFGHDLFVSFALGPPPRGSQAYASDLTRRLREYDYSVFFSEDDAIPGQLLTPAIRRALARSRAMVVVVNRFTLAEPRWVRTEVETFRRLHPGRAIVPLALDDAFDDPAVRTACADWLDAESSIRVNERGDAAAAGIASEDTVRRLTLVPRHLRANRRWRTVLGGAFTLFAVLTIAFGWAAKVASDQSQLAQRSAEEARTELRESTAQRLAAQASAMRTGVVLGGDVRSLLQTLAAAQLSAAPEIQSALVDAFAHHDRMTWLVDDSRGMQGVRFTSDGREILTLDMNGTTIRWAADRGRRLGTAAGDTWHSLGTLADRRWVVAGRDKLTILREGVTDEAFALEMPSNVLIHTARVHPAGNFFVAFDRDGGIASVSLRSGALLGSSIPPGREDGRFTDMAVAPTGTAVVVATLGGALRWWRLDPQRGLGKSIRIEHRHGSPISAMSFTDDGTRLVTGDMSGKLILWDTRSGTVLHEFADAHAGEVAALAFSHDGLRLASGAKDGTLQLWRTGLLSPLGPLHKAHRRDVLGLSFGPDGRQLASAGFDDTLRLWQVADLGVESKPAASEMFRVGRAVRSAAFSVDGQRLAVGNDEGQVEVWDVAAKRPAAPARQGHAGWVTAIAISDDGRSVATTGHDRKVRIHDVETEEVTGWTIDAGEAATTALRFSPDGRQVATGHWTGAAKLWDVATRSLVASLAARPGALFDVHVSALAFSRDGRSIAIGTRDDRIRIWRPSTDTLSIDREGGHGASVQAIAFTPDGAKVLSAGVPQRLRLHRTVDGEPIATALSEHQGSSFDVAMAADGRWFVSADDPLEPSIRMWSLDREVAIGPAFPTNGHQVRAMTVQPGSDLILYVTAHGRVRALPTPAAMAKLLCNKIGRSITAAEWTQWVSPSIAYSQPCPE